MDERAVVEAEELFEALHEQPPPKRFRVDLADRGRGWGDVSLAYRPGTVGRWVFWTLVVLCAVGAPVGMLAAPDLQFALAVGCAAGTLALGFCLVAYHAQSVLEIEMKGSAGRVWRYWLVRGKGRAFAYDANTEFFFYTSSTLTGRLFMTELSICPSGAKPVRVRYTMGEADMAYLNAVLLYALPKDESWFEVADETPEEAAIRRTNEAAEVADRKMAKWRAVRVLLVLAVLVAVRVGFRRGWFSPRPSPSPYVRAVLEQYGKGGDWRETARTEKGSDPDRALVARWSEAFAAEAALAAELAAEDGLTAAELDSLRERCRAARQKAEADLTDLKSKAARALQGARCKMIEAACERALRELGERNAPPTARARFKRQ
ncbi:MAG: hypothetical protein IJ829_03025 [Kiritimatiellae bacterium]|nr:hypothetical protein [Kiritimatiellia bacterium]